MWGSAMIVGVWEWGGGGGGREKGGGVEGGGREGVLWCHTLCIGCHLDTEYNTPNPTSLHRNTHTVHHLGRDSL